VVENPGTSGKRVLCLDLAALNGNAEGAPADA
jgi:hypothetical protein